MKALVNINCIGCGLCAATCPEVFHMEGNVAEAISGEVPEALQPDARDAQAGCPVDAIELD